MYYLYCWIQKKRKEKKKGRESEIDRKEIGENEFILQLYRRTKKKKKFVD